MKRTQIMSIEDRSKQGIVLKANALTFVLVSFPKLLMFHGFFMFHVVFKDVFARYFLILYSIRNYFLMRKFPRRYDRGFKGDPMQVSI